MRSFRRTRLGAQLASLGVALAFLVACGSTGARPAAQPPAAQPPTAQPAAPASAPTTAPAQSAPKPAQATQPAAGATAAAKPATAAQANGEPDPALVAAAEKDGKVVWYASMELTLVKNMAKAFEQKYGIPVEVNRSGSEKIFAQFMKEQGSNVFSNDVVQTSDVSNFVTMKAEKLLVPYQLKAADAFEPSIKAHLVDADNFYYSIAQSANVIVYNPTKVNDDQAPKAWKDILDPKWKSKIVHAHPGYSGNVLTSMWLLLGMYGDDFYKQLAQNDPLIVQSALDVPVKVVSGEREIGAGSSIGGAIQNIRKGNPIKISYPSDGMPTIPQPIGIAKNSQRQNAAKLFTEWTFSKEAQEMIINQGGYYSPRADIALSKEQKPLSQIKALFADPAKVEKDRDKIQKLFKQLFGV